jgi:acyl carrier protein
MSEAEGNRREDILAAIRRELEPHNPGKAVLTEATDIVEELSIDSIAVMDMVCALEEEFDVMIPLNTLSNVRTIGDLASRVEAEAGQG